MSQVVAKCEPLIASLANEEGLKQLTVEKATAALQALEKRNTQATIE